MDEMCRLKIMEIFDFDMEADPGRALYINKADCERITGPFHNQFQHYGGFKDEP